MSASDKKKLRKEQNATAITERQQKSRKEAKQLKAYTVTFVILMVLVVAIFLGITLRSPVVGIINRNTTAITVADQEITTTELNYYYTDYIQNFVNQYSSYGTYASMYLQMYTGLNTALPLDEQVYDKDTGETWADYFLKNAKANAQWAHAMYDKAMSENFTLTDTEQKNLELQESNLELVAQYNGFSNGKTYLRNLYGYGANVKTYMEYTKLNTIANGYATKHYDSFEFKDEDYRKHEEGKFSDYSSYSFSYYYVTVNNYLTFLGGGTEVKGEDGKTTVTYTDAQKEAARKAAEEAAKGLAVESNANIEKLNEAIKALDLNKSKKDVAATENDYVLSGSIQNADFKKWVTDSTRKVGDITYIVSKTGEGEDATVTGYYVLLFEGSTDNKTPLANVQHILVKFTGGKKDDKTGQVTYTDDEKKATELKAQGILNEFLKGEKQDSEAFGKLAGAKSEDTGSKSTGGLIEGIHRDAGYVESFTDWALAGHKPGDTGIIESEYGYHVMFYKEDGKLTYRDYMIDIDLTNKAFEAWENSIIGYYPVTDKNLKGIEMDMVIGG